MQHNDILKYFAKYIEDETGITYAEHNFYQLQNRLEEIAKLVDVPDLVKLQEHAQGGITGQFRQLLLDIATNNETSFFRDPRVFNAIEGLLLEASSPSKLIAGLNIWSAASSSGQEALSLAMLITEWSKKKQIPVNFRITGTDISERILDKARAGRYSQLEVQRGLSAPLLIKYFKKDEKDYWKASPDLLSKIEYKKINLKEFSNFSSKFDLILIRNVLIYQSVANKIKIISRVTQNLSSDGYLVLGAGESLIGLSNEYSQVAHNGVVIYKHGAEKQKVA